MSDSDNFKSILDSTKDATYKSWDLKIVSAWNKYVFLYWLSLGEKNKFYPFYIKDVDFKSIGYEMMPENMVGLILFKVKRWFKK